MNPNEIERVLTQHDNVAQAVVVDQDPGTVAYVVLRAATAAADTRAEEQVTEWQEIFDRLYGSNTSAEFGENFAGWNSAYDRRPIDVAEMRQWRDRTVERIRELEPRRVVELGAGSGLLLAPLARDCEEYWATDLSSVGVDELARHVSADPALADRVVLRSQGADDVDGLPAAHFDTAVINSVVQLFPSGSYLTTVINRALTLLKPGGSLFVGDIRDLRTRDYLFAAIALRHPRATDADAVRRLAQKHGAKDEELFVHPDFFLDIARSHPDVAGVDVQLKQSNHHNELTRHRYDIVLHKAPSQATDVSGCPQLRWGDEVTSLAELDKQVAASAGPLRVTGVPNARLAGEAAALRAVEAGDSARAAELARSIDPDSVDPHDVSLLATAAGRHAVFAPSAAQADRFEVVFVAGKEKLIGTYPVADPARPQLTESPAAAHRGAALSAQLGDWLRDKVPARFLPTSIVALDDLPLLPDGTVDRTSLGRVAHGLGDPA
ncbi:methyltransferase domain-containing protein [Saccharopolyspora taberi]|uniref:Uncharacterized protein n=1 Tax=Saccharopolyspora taberi TaxID=60895 RepID=A0ABN3V3N3_9PSEU